MKKLFVILFICQCYVVAAQNQKEISRHYRVLDSLVNKNKYAEVIEYTRQVAPFFEKNNGFPLYHYYKLQITYLALAYEEANQHDEAEKVLLKLMPEIEHRESRLNMWYKNAAILYSTICLKTGQFTKAYQYSVNVWKTSPVWWKFEPWNYIKLCSGLITMSSNLGMYEDAIAYADKFEATIMQTRYTKADLATYYLTLLGLYAQMGSTQKMVLYTQRIDSLMSDSFKEKGIKIQIKNTQANLLLMAGNTDSAEKVIMNAMKEMDPDKMKNTEAYQLTLNSLAQLWVHKKKVQNADSLLKAFFAARGTVKNNYTWTLYFTMALLKHATADHKAALLYTDTALSLQPKTAWSSQQVSLPVIEINRSMILLKLNRFEEAWSAYEKLIADYIQYIKKNISYLSEPDKNNLLVNYYNVANFAPAFIAAAKKEILPAVIKKSWTEALFFRGIAMGEQGKLYRALRKGSDSVLMKLYKEVIDIKQTLNFTKKNTSPGGKVGYIDNLALVMEKKELQLLQHLPAETEKDTMDIVTKLHQYLQPGEAIIDFTGFTNISNASANSKYYGAYILRYDDPNPLFQALCTEEALKKVTKGDSIGLLYPSAVLAYNPRFPGYELYKLLWQPIKANLKGIKTVFIVPDGLLHKIAFHALPVRKGVYLSDSMDIRYLYHPSSIYREDFRKTVKPSNVQVWAGINYDSAAQPVKHQGIVKISEQEINPLELKGDNVKAWEPLKGGLKDAEKLKVQCKKNGISYRLYTGTDATENACKEYTQDSSDLLAFITHGTFYKDYFTNAPVFSMYMNMPFSLVRNPMQQAGLIMAGRNKLIDTGTHSHFGDDRVLRASEIARLNLDNKKLVVLNACLSGLGEVVSAEGVYGMARAFKLAGAERVLVSLWNVDDTHIGEMMSFFYKLLLEGKSAGAALKSARQHMRKKYSPYYWAGFVLIE